MKKPKIEIKKQLKGGLIWYLLIVDGNVVLASQNEEPVKQRKIEINELYDKYNDIKLDEYNG